MALFAQFANDEEHAMSHGLIPDVRVIEGSSAMVAAIGTGDAFTSPRLRIP